MALAQPQHEAPGTIRLSVGAKVVKCQNQDEIKTIDEAIGKAEI